MDLQKKESRWNWSRTIRRAFYAYRATDPGDCRDHGRFFPVCGSGGAAPGIFTVRGGHRIGVAGRTVLNQREVGVLKSISSLNVRVAHEVKGCADQIMPLLCEMGFFKYGNRIAAGMRKTTLLRDIIRQLSNGCREKAREGVSLESQSAWWMSARNWGPAFRESPKMILE